MAEASLEQGAQEGQFRLLGELGFDTVPALLRHAEGRLTACPRLEIDLAGVSRADSAGLALLIEWLRQARARAQEIRFVNMPEQMRALVRVSGLDEVLPLEARAD